MPRYEINNLSSQLKAIVTYPKASASVLYLQFKNNTQQAYEPSQVFGVIERLVDKSHQGAYQIPEEIEKTLRSEFSYLLAEKCELEIKEEARALLKVPKSKKPDELVGSEKSTATHSAYPLNNPLWSEARETIVKTSLSLLSSIPADEIVVAPGRSPFFHALVLQEYRSNIFSFAFSRHCYLKESFPTSPQLQCIRHYLESIGLTPTKLINSPSIHLIDYVESFGTIESLLFLFAHWLHDIKAGTVTDAKTWFNSSNKAQEYELFFNKLKIYGLQNPCPMSSLFPHFKQVPYINVPLPGALKMYLSQNRAYVPLPFYPVKCWEIMPNLKETDPDYYDMALKEKELLLAEVHKVQPNSQVEGYSTAALIAASRKNMTIDTTTKAVPHNSVVEQERTNSLL
ncbi:MAG: hypothetical protein H0U75_07365 [Legionella sp.]|nr:hypothetical protein [Legionella sp.]